MKIKYILFSLFSLLFCVKFTFAGDTTLTGSIYTQNQYRSGLNKYSINLFEQTHNHTGFSDFIYSHGYDIGFYLNDYFGISDSNFFTNQYKYNISILSYGDFESFLTRITYKSNSITENIEIIDYLFDPNYSGYYKYHKLVYLPGYSFSDIEYFIAFSSTLNNNNFNRFSFNIYQDYVSLSISPKYIFMFDSSGTPVGYLQFGCGDNAYGSACSYPYNTGQDYGEAVWLNFIQPFTNNVDMTSWYAWGFKMGTPGHTYWVDSTYTEYTKIYPKTFYLDSSNGVSLQNNAGYSGISGWFSNLFSSYHQVSHYNLRFVYDDVYYSNSSTFKSLWDIWFSSDTTSVPSNFNSFDDSTYDKGYYLTPKSGCDSANYMLYFSNEVNISTYAIYFNYYQKVSDNGTDSLVLYKQLGAYASVANSPYSYSPLVELGATTSELLNYTINIYQYSTIYSYRVYYNPVCWTLSGTSSDVSLPFSSGTMTLDTYTVSSNYSNHTVNGVNYVNGSTTSSNATSNSNVPYSSFLSSNVSGNLDSVTTHISDYLTGFYNSIVAVVGITGVFLTGLPSELWFALQSVFFIGLIIILIKAIR